MARLAGWPAGWLDWPESQPDRQPASLAGHRKGSRSCSCVQCDHKKLFFVINKNYSYLIWPDCIEKPCFLAGWPSGWISQKASQTASQPACQAIEKAPEAAAARQM